MSRSRPAKAANAAKVGAAAKAAAKAAVVAVVAVACGDDGGSGSSAATSTSPTTTVAATTSAPTTTVAVTTTSPTPRPALADVTLSGGAEADGYMYEVTFPTVSGLPAAVDQAVNDRTRAEVTAVVDEFVAAAKEFPPGAGPGPASGLTGTYQLDRLDDGLLSFRLPVSRYFAGAAHPGTVLLTFTYDLRTGRKLALADLFTDGTPYLERLSELSRQQLLAQPDFQQLPEFVAPGTEPTAENFAGFTVTDQELVITFAEYQVAPYALGMPRVGIPYASLRTLLDPAGPLALHN